jgi:hypothetical protein
MISLFFGCWFCFSNNARHNTIITDDKNIIIPGKWLLVSIILLFFIYTGIYVNFLWFPIPFYRWFSFVCFWPSFKVCAISPPHLDFLWFQRCAGGRGEYIFLERCKNAWSRAKSGLDRAPPAPPHISLPLTSSQPLYPTVPLLPFPVPRCPPLTSPLTRSRHPTSFRWFSRWWFSH